MNESRRVVLVPYLDRIESSCEDGLRKLERTGIPVFRRQGRVQIDVVRNEMMSDALQDGFESILSINPDIGFDPADAERLLNNTDPVVAGVYAKQGRREMAGTFADGIEQVRFGPGAPSLYALKYVAAGFLRVRADVLRKMTVELKLPLCNRSWGRGFWPFFQPIIVPTLIGDSLYLNAEQAFSNRLAQIGVTPLADTSFRLWHFGSFGYSWEDAGADHPRYRTYDFQP